MTEPLRMSFEVACSAEHAFATWTSRIASWWPATRAPTRPRSSARSARRRSSISCARFDDPHAWLTGQGGWVQLGAADEQKAAKQGTVEAWGRSPDKPVGGWYGLRKGYRGRFGMYLPPLLEELGLAELTHEKRNNTMRARPGH
jgi:hypothetical protein